MGYTKLLLHCDSAGVPGYFVDSSVNNYAVTTAGHVVTDSTQYKFGNYSGVFDGTDDYLSLADSDDWNFGSGNFTIDFRFRFNALSATSYFVSQESVTSNYWALYCNANGSLVFEGYADGGGTFVNLYTGAGAVSADSSWHHLAFVRNGTTGLVFVDGVSVAFGGTQFGTATMNDIGDQLWIGAREYGSVTYEFNGWIDEFRISKGIARWTSNFTPPTQAYTAFEEYTQSLTETITSSDSLTKSVGYKRTFLETITTSDNYVDVFNVIRAFLETATLSDVLGKSVGRWGNLTDSMTLADVIEIVRGTGRDFVDAVTLSDTLSFVQTLKKNFSDTMTLTDVLTRIIGKNFNDSITMSDSFSKSIDISRTFSDSISLVENPFSMTEAGETIVDISKNPQIAAGEKHGELLTIHHITNLPKLQITNGRGVSLMGGGKYIMGSGDTLTLVYQTDNSIWQETSRGRYL